MTIIIVIAFLLLLLTVISLDLWVPSVVLALLDMGLAITVLLGATQHVSLESWLGWCLVILCLRMGSRAFWDGVSERLLKTILN